MSLRTKDPRVAKERVTAEFDRFNATLESARSRLSGNGQTLSARQVAAIVGAAYRRWLDKQGDSAGSQKTWQAELNELTGLFQADEHGEYTFEWELWVLCDADAELRAQGIVAGEATKIQVAEQWARARISFVRAMIGRCEGDWSRPASLDRFPVIVDAPKPKPKPVIIEDLLDGWATETQKSEKALYDRQRTVAAFTRHLGHNDAARVTADDVVAYKFSTRLGGLTGAKWLWAHIHGASEVNRHGMARASDVIVATVLNVDRSDCNTHPAQFPLSLAEPLIRMFRSQGGLVFDPFVGSGTTGVAALRAGRNFVGLETRGAYVNIARKRLISF